MNRILVFRKGHSAFHSIENIFATVLPFLDAKAIELPYESKGIWNRIRNIFFLKEQNADLIHISGHDHYLLWYPFKNAILTIHDIEALNRKQGFKKWLFKKLWFDIPIKNATLVTTISEFTRQELLSLNDYKTPIKVIPNPLTIQTEFEPKSNWPERLKVLHIGTKENKNLERLSKALVGLNCELSIVGKLSDTQLQKLNKMNISYRNCFRLSDKELKTEYQNCDLLAFVSTYEGFGLPIIEAQAIGRVVLTSNLASMPEVAGDAAYFVDPYSVEDISKGIKTLIENPVLRAELIVKGRENIKRFDPQLIAAQYQALYNEVASET